MSSENENEIERTWMKIADVASKAGYREGAGAGRDEAFQRSFDDGYFEGFKNGFILGKYKGTLRAFSKQNDEELTDSHLEKTKRGWCQICKEDLKDDTVETCKRKQNDYSNSLLKEMCLKYSNICNVSLESGVD